MRLTDEQVRHMKIFHKNGNLTADAIDMLFETIDAKHQEAERLKKAFVLACRLVSDNFTCPAVDSDASFPECNGEMEMCGDDDVWKCWQRYFYQVVDSEAVCRVCGCTQYNACEGGCYWVEEDLCSKCTEREGLQYAEVGSDDTCHEKATSLKDVKEGE